MRPLLYLSALISRNPIREIFMTRKAIKLNS